MTRAEAGAPGPGSVALVTGANRGLGLETARQLGERGLTVLIGARDSSRGVAAAGALAAEGLDARPLLLDVTDAASVASALAEVEGRLGRLDVLVNNAGVHLHRAPPSELDPERVRGTLEVNLMGPLVVTQAFLPLLRASPAGRVVNVSTELASLFRLQDPQWRYHPHAAPSAGYSASKAALNVLTIAFARELSDTRVKVNAVEPGFTATDFNQHRGTRAPRDAVGVIVRFALLPADGPTGGFFDEHGRLPW